MLKKTIKKQTCKHCKCSFDNISIGKFRNHIKWCNKNPKRDQTYKHAREICRRTAEKKFGKFKQFEVICYTCKQRFNVIEREKLFPKKAKYFCNRSCANSQGGKGKKKNLIKNGKLHYRVHALDHIKDHKCFVCGFDKIIEVHHLDKNRQNNSLDNLVLLCPNHHKMIHTKKYKQEILEAINNYRNTLNGLVK